MPLTPLEPYSPIPEEPDFIDDAFQWPCWKFGMRLDALWKSLHEEYNTWKAPMAEFEIFALDVKELSHIATTKEEFLSSLEARKKQRVEELAGGWDAAAIHLSIGHKRLSDHQWGHATRFFRTKAVDTMVAFLYSLLDEEEQRKANIFDEGLLRDSNVGQAFTSRGVTSPYLTPLQLDKFMNGNGCPVCNRKYEEHGGVEAEPADTPSPKPAEEEPPASGTPGNITSDHTKSNKHTSRSPLAPTDPLVGNLGPRKSRNRVSKKRSAPRSRMSRAHAMTEEPETQSRYNLRPRAPRKAR
ncbi:hypothetical protein GGR51DRAFT_569461 [Nemania sp. FL0031]|nr:hypothetical protein GGR51DRAFT_569461 [Nemania sp. FL0031]